MRDAILARGNSAAEGVLHLERSEVNFSMLLQVEPAGVDIDVTRGWTSVNAKVRNAPTFRFVNTHLEAFDSQASNPTNQDTNAPQGRGAPGAGSGTDRHRRPGNRQPAGDPAR